MGSQTADHSSLATTRRSLLSGGAFGFALLGAGLIYAIQIPGPLRVNQDAVDLLELASKLTDHQPYLLRGLQPLFPIGIPWLFSTMERLHIASALGFNALNFLCIVLSALAAGSIFKSLGQNSKLAVTALTISFCSFVLLKHAGIPLTDLPYAAVSLSAVALLEHAKSVNDRQKIIAIVSGAVLIVIAILIRRIGIALIPAFVYSLMLLAVQKQTTRSNEMGRKARIAFVISILVVTGLPCLIFRRHLLYAPEQGTPVVGQSAVQKAAIILYMRSVDMGEVLLNVPAAKLRALAGLVPAAGVGMMVVLLAGLSRERRRLKTVHIYLMAYVTVLFAWPYGDHRFWLPVLPIFALVTVEAIEPFMGWRAVRAVVSAYAIEFVALFLIAAVYTTRITYSTRFPEVYADGKSAEDYRQAWSDGAVQTPAAIVIRRYGMR